MHQLKNSFCPTIKITTTWNVLPNELVSSRTVNSFKNRLCGGFLLNPCFSSSKNKCMQITQYVIRKKYW